MNSKIFKSSLGFFGANIHILKFKAQEVQEIDANTHNISMLIQFI